MPVNSHMVYVRLLEVWSEPNVGHQLPKMMVYFTGGSPEIRAPQSRWQRGSNEQINALLRQYFPRGVALSNVHQNHLNAIARRLNERPRQTLDFETPAERFARCVALTGWNRNRFRHLSPIKPDNRVLIVTASGYQMMCGQAINPAP